MKRTVAGFLPLSQDIKEDLFDMEIKNIRSLYSKELSGINDAVIRVVDKVDYKNSPIYNENVNKDFLNKLITDVIQLIEIVEVLEREISFLIEVLLINEIFVNRRLRNF